MFDSVFLLIIGFFSFGLLYLINCYNKKFKYWSNKGVKGPKPFYLFGNDLDKAFKSWPDADMEYAKKYGKLYGIYNGTQPVLCVMEKELIKDIMIKDFHCFINRPRINLLHEMEQNNLFLLESDNWKRVRTITGPSFTSGKLRAMVPLMEKCVDKFAAYFDKAIQQKDGVVDIKKVTTGFTIDVIASTSFATDTNANDDRSGENVFVENSKKMLEVSKFRIIAIALFPKSLLRFLNILTLFHPAAFEFLVDTTKEIVRQRREQKSTRNDLVQLMMDAAVDENELNRADFEKLSATENDSEDKNRDTHSTVGSKKQLSETEIIANSVFFFFAGFETTSSTISHCMYNLATNPHIQERLYNEVKNAMDKNESSDHYDLVINNIPYLDAVIKETLRIYPPVSELFRQVGVDNYKIRNFTIEKNTMIIVPTHAIHHCPEYYPDPTKFDPNRFMPENKHLLVPYTYMPFGQGPRNCMGMRFAYQELKLCMARLALNYQFHVTPNTPRKLTFAPSTPLLKTNDIELRLTKRS